MTDKQPANYCGWNICFWEFGPVPVLACAVKSVYFNPLFFHLPGFISLLYSHSYIIYFSSYFIVFHLYFHLIFLHYFIILSFSSGSFPLPSLLLLSRSFVFFPFSPPFPLSFINILLHSDTLYFFISSVPPWISLFFITFLHSRTLPPFHPPLITKTTQNIWPQISFLCRYPWVPMNATECQRVPLSTLDPLARTHPQRTRVSLAATLSFSAM